jgi:serine/threonine protein kinase
VFSSCQKMLVMEYLCGGDLMHYLMKLHKNPSELSSPDLPSLLLQFCKQVVDGLACLARKSFVHRDIAARNILLDKELNCKVGKSVNVIMHLLLFSSVQTGCKKYCSICIVAN